MNMHRPPAEGNLCEEHGKVQKHVNVEDYSQHMAYIEEEDRLAKNYSVSQRTWK
jgi:hypothetical protein